MDNPKFIHDNGKPHVSKAATEDDHNHDLQLNGVTSVQNDIIRKYIIASTPAIIHIIMIYSNIRRKQYQNIYIIIFQILFYIFKICLI